MRRVSMVGIAVLTGSVLAVIPVDRARAGEPGGQITVAPGDQSGVFGQPSVGIGAASPGSSAASGNVASSGGSGSPVACVFEPAGQIASEMFAAGTPGYAGNVAGGGSKGYFLVCNGVHEGWLNGPDQFPAGAALVTPEQLAQQAYQLLVLPLPVPHFSPDVRTSSGLATVVGEHTWVWTDKNTWAAQSKRVQAGAVWAEVTATPTKLVFTPGADRPLACAGPGTAYTTAAGLHAASPDCDYVFEQPRDHVEATFAIQWSVSWTGSTGTAPAVGTLPPMTSRAAAGFAVAEIQSLNAS
jgi:hypothetical protein